MDYELRRWTQSTYNQMIWKRVQGKIKVLQDVQSIAIGAFLKISKCYHVSFHSTFFMK